MLRKCRVFPAQNYHSNGGASMYDDEDYEDDDDESD